MEDGRVALMEIGHRILFLGYRASDISFWRLHCIDGYQASDEGRVAHWM